MKSMKYFPLSCFLLVCYGFLSSCENRSYNEQSIIEFDSLLQIGKVVEAEQIGEKIVMEATKDIYSNDYVSLLNQMALINLHNGRLGNAEYYAVKSLEVIGTLHKNSSPEYTHTVFLLGNVYYYGQVYNRALQYLQQAIVLRSPMDTVSLEVADNYYLISGCMAALAQYHESAHYMEKAQILYRKNNALDSNRQFKISKELALLYSYIGRQKEAEELGNLSIVIAEQWKGKQSVEYAESLKTMSMVSIRGKDTLSAIQQMAEAIHILKNIPDEFYSLFDALKSIAELYSVSGNIIKANEYYAIVMNGVDSLRLNSKELFPIASPLASYGHHLLLCRDYKKAEEKLMEALAIFESKLGDDNPRVRTVLKDLHTLYIATERYDKAQKVESALLKVDTSPL